jgi:ATP-dependent helicase/nuclease subunit B
VSLRVITTPYGRAASEALRGEIARAKEASPLAPVTVVVPGNSVGVAVRRLLASGALGPVSNVGSGLIGVNFLTASRLAELLAAARLAARKRRPVSPPVVAAAVRRVLASAAGMFAPVATHPATEEALVAAVWELSDLDDAALDLLSAQSERAREVVRIHRAAKGHLAAAWYDEHDLMRAACDVVSEGGPLVGELGTLVYHLPQRTTAPVARLLRTIAERNELVVIAALTGAPKADAEVIAGIERLGASIDAETADVIPAVGTAVCSTSDADDEVRVMVRGVVDAMRDGVPLERMAIVFGNAEPYARLLHDHLELAGIAHNGVSVRTLADSVLGRSLLRLLALADDDFRREDVCALMAGAPVLDGRGQLVQAAAWERISRDAGVVGGVAQWKARLARYVNAQVPRSDDDGAVARADAERARAAGLQRFVERLAADLEGAPASWRELASWARGLVHRWIGDEDARANWVPFEREAARRVDAALERLGGLDAVEAGPTLGVFRRSLTLELDAARDQVGRLGEGLLVGPAVLALGVELDRVWVCGLAEGVYPGSPRDDPLLADADRHALGGQIRLRSGRIADDHRALLAALANTSGERVLCFPRGDLRRNTEHVPSRFLLDTVESLTGSRPLVSALPVGEEWYTAVPSFVHGLTHAAFPPTRHELEVRAMLAREPWIAADPGLARGMALAQARRSRAFTRFDGNLAHLRDRMAPWSPAAPDVEVSATRLQAWASCPHAYFAHYVLHVDAIERPEEIVQLSALDRGSVMHAALDRFLAELIGQPGVGRPWAAAQRERLHEIMREACDEVEASGLGGRRLLWERARRQMHDELDRFLDADTTYREEQGAETLATELGFGKRDPTRPAIEIACSDGRTLRLGGSVDRIDRWASGELAVIDYKTGGQSSFKGLSHEDPLLGGQLLQLPIYAHAVRSVFGLDRDVAVDSSYWFVKEPKTRLGYLVDEPVEKALDRALIAIVDGIESGVFVGRAPAPGAWKTYVECPYCDPDALGTTDRHRDWLRKVAAPELAGYLELVGIEQPEGEAPDDRAPAVEQLALL